MAINRTTILRGPGTVIYNTGNDAQTIFDATGITAEVESSTQDIPSSVSGTIDTIKTDQVGTVKFTPCGQLDADLLALLYPYGNPTIGARVFPNADVPLAVHSVGGTKVTFVNAALTQMPPLLLSPVKTAFGEAVFTALLGLNKAPGDSNSFFTTATATYAAGGPDPAGIVGVQYAASFGSLDILDTLDGWTVTPELSLEPVTTDLLGTIDYTVGGVTVTATCTPLGLTEEQILGALPITKGRGQSLAGANDLVIAGEGGLTVTLKNATMMRGPLQWGNTTLRAGEVAFVAHRSFSSGTPGPIFSVALTE